jgi:hypothetical protein
MIFAQADAITTRGDCSSDPQPQSEFTALGAPGVPDHDDASCIPLRQF